MGVTWAYPVCAEVGTPSTVQPVPSGRLRQETYSCRPGQEFTKRASVMLGLAELGEAFDVVGRVQADLLPLLGRCLAADLAWDTEDE